MKIANKITLLIVFLLCVLFINTWIGLRQMNNIREEFAAMANYDMVLMESIGTIHQLQLQKNVLLQQLIGFAEELGFEQIGFARKEYVRDQLKNIREGFERYAQMGAQQTLQARRSGAGAYDVANDQDQRAQLRAMLEGLNHLEVTRRDYDASMARMLSAVELGGFQLSLEDLENIQRQENDLSKRVEGLLKQVQGFSRASLAKAGQWESQAQHVLVFSLCMTVFLGCFLAFWIARSIVRPLRTLSMAAVQVGQGDFDVHLNASSKDELGQLALAFNTMGQQLEEFKIRLEKQNKDLKESNADLDRFIHIMGHDIVGPLTVMIGYCAYVEQHNGILMDEKSREALQGIRRSSTKMHQMVKELLEFTESKRV